MARGERKKFQIKARRGAARLGFALSTTVVLYEDGYTGVCCISFDQSLVEFVGAQMPRGVSPVDPAYLQVVKHAGEKVWAVSARYLRGDTTVVLWETKTRPTWLKAQSSGGLHGTTSNPARSSRSGCVHGRSTGGPETDPGAPGAAGKRIDARRGARGHGRGSARAAP